MSEEDEIEKLSKSAHVVIFHSPLTDLGGLDHDLNRRGRRWKAVEMPMGDPANRERYRTLERFTGQTTLPQVFVDGHFVGGIRAAREHLRVEDTGAGAGTETPPDAPAISLAAMGCTALAMLPLIGLAAWLWVHPGSGYAARLLSIYGGIALAIIGTVHFGWALAGRSDARRYWWSAVPPLAGWILASLPTGVALPLLGSAHALVWYAERQWFAGDLPRWYVRLRVPIAWLAIACLFAAWIGTLVHGA